MWSIATGECVRCLKHECYVRSVAMDGFRIATGDVSGMAYVWSLDNVLNSAMGSGHRMGGDEAASIQISRLKVRHCLVDHFYSAKDPRSWDSWHSVTACPTVPAFPGYPRESQQTFSIKIQVS